MENLVTVASVNIFKATLQRIEPAIKSSQEALLMEADPCNQPIDGSNIQVEDSVDITEGVGDYEMLGMPTVEAAQTPSTL